MVLRPWVARRHFFETGTLRYFDVTFGTPEGVSATAEAELGGADGRIVYLLPEGPESVDDLVGAATGAAQRSDLVFGVPREGRSLLAGAHDWCAWESVRRSVGALSNDPVARRELSARIHFATDRLDTAVQSCFGLVDGARVAWVHDGAPTAWSGARALSSALSAVCDRSFPEAPLVRNELLNRRSLSSAAAAARRSLLDAMIEHGARPRLGIEGTPPEYSMYASLLAAGGLHREVRGRWGYGAPLGDDPLRLRPTWSAHRGLPRRHRGRGSPAASALRRARAEAHRSPRGADAGALLRGGALDPGRGRALRGRQLRPGDHRGGGGAPAPSHRSLRGGALPARRRAHRGAARALVSARLRG
jgi:hypothetical protein